MNDIEIAAEKFGVLDRVPMGVCVLREDFVVLYWNRCLETWTHLPRQQILGNNISQYFPHLSTPKYASRLGQIFAGGPPTIFSSQLHKHLIPAPLPDGRLRIQHTTVTAEPAADGRYYALFSIQDVTELTQRVQEYRTMRDQALAEIEERQRADEALRSREEQLRTLINAMPDLVYFKDAAGRWVEANKTVLELLQLADVDYRGKTNAELSEFSHFYSDVFFQCQQTDEEMWSRGIVSSSEQVIPVPDGSTKIYDMIKVPIYHEDGQRRGIVILGRDITQRKQVEAALQEAKEQLRAVLDAVPGLVSWISSDLRYIGVNKHLCETYNQPPEAFIGQEIGFLENSRGFAQFVSQFLHSSEVAARYVIDAKINGSTRNYLIAAQKYQQGQAAVTVGIDITEQKQTEEQLKKSLREKEVLLKEIHHRVKNNLQITSSLLKLQSEHIKDEEMVLLFTDSYNRIRSMALIHEKLYQSQDMAIIDASDYVHNMARNLFLSYRMASNKIHLRVDVDDIFLDVDTAIPCGLIINELVSNSLKYAFSIGKYGILDVRLKSSDNNILFLEVSDNGVGLPPDFDIEETESLGLQLVSNLTEQLAGSMEIDSSRGTSFKITFPKQRNTCHSKSG